MNPAGADIIYDASNYAVTYQQLAHYGEKVCDRFPSIGSPIYAGGYVSYFDITPDLKFILGPDSVSTAATKCAKWRRESVPVWLREKGREALVSCVAARIEARGA